LSRFELLNLVADSGNYQQIAVEAYVITFQTLLLAETLGKMENRNFGKTSRAYFRIRGRAFGRNI
jgi:hypothetical protein